jgi:hypothetical protein
MGIEKKAASWHGNNQRKNGGGGLYTAASTADTGWLYLPHGLHRAAE